VLTMGDDCHCRFGLIHHVRNAVAHARFSIGDDERFTFWDQRNEASAPYFRASCSFESLGEFLLEVGRLFGNLRVTKS
jgi:hypothetical protein